jgi:hypothetical protein
VESIAQSSVCRSADTGFAAEKVRDLQSVVVPAGMVETVVRVETTVESVK